MSPQVSRPQQLQSMDTWRTQRLRRRGECLRYLNQCQLTFRSSGIFSLNLGLVFIGFAVGPTLGSLLISYTGRTISVFFAAGIVHLIYASLIWVIVPESLSRSRMEEAKYNHAQRSSEPLLRHENPRIQRALAGARRLLMFMSPLSVFFPDLRPHSNPLKKPKRDWNLTLLAAAYGFTMALMVCPHYQP
jgi:MFS family permease